jgi:hypothetical protein
MGFNSNVRDGVGDTRFFDMYFSYSDNGGNDLVAPINASLTADANYLLCRMIPLTSAELNLIGFEEEPTNFLLHSTISLALSFLNGSPGTHKN